MSYMTVIREKNDSNWLRKVVRYNKQKADKSNAFITERMKWN